MENWISVEEESAAAAQPVAEAQPQQWEELNDPISDPLPSYADGLSPDTPINRSPLSSTERLLIRGLGTRKGEVSNLAEMFGQDAVRVDRNGDLVVKKGDSWYAVDPNTLDSPEPISRTKRILGALAGAGAAGYGTVAALTGVHKTRNPLEIADMITGLIKDDELQAVAKETTGEIAENIPTAAAVGAGLVTMPMTLAGVAGAGMIAGGVTSAKVILGKLAGTYEATPEETAQEIVMDTMLGVAGQAVSAGAKFGFKYLADKKALKALQETGEELTKRGGNLEELAQTFAEQTGWPKRVYQTYMTSGKRVQGIVDELASLGDSDQLARLRTMSTTEARRAVDVLKEGSESLWQKNNQQLRSLIPDNVEFNMADLTDDWVKSMKDAGLVEEVARTTTTKMPGAGTKTLQVVKEVPPGTALTGGSRDVSGIVTDTVTKNRIDRFLSFEEYQSKVVGNAQLDKTDFAFSRQTYNRLKQLYADVQTLRTKSPITFGKEGFDNTMAANRILKSITYEMRAAGLSNSSNPLIRNAAKAADNFDSAVATKVLGGTQDGSAGAAYLKLNQDWSAYKNAIAPFERAAAKNDLNTLAQIGSKLLSKPKAGNMNEQEAIGAAIEYLSKNNITAPAAKLADITKQFEAIEAAGYIGKIANKPIFNDAQWGMMLGGLLSGSPWLTGSVAATGAATSPKVAKMLIDRQAKVAQIVKAAGGAARDKIILNPPLLKTLLQFPRTSTEQQTQTESMLLEKFGIPKEQP
jgi:hypothetical protein